MNRFVTRGILTALALLVALPVSAQSFGRLEFIVPGGPGSGQDQAARAFEEALRAEKLITGGQIIHYAGGGGMIAVSQFLTGKVGNGNAVVTQGAGHLSFPLSNKTPVSLNDVIPLARIAGEYELLVVRTNSEFKTVEDLIANVAEVAAVHPAALDYMTQLLREQGLDVEELKKEEKASSKKDKDE